MDPQQIYYGSLVLIAILAWMSYQSDRMLTMLILLAMGAYFIYSHNTGKTITNLTDETVKTLDKKL